MLWTVVSALVVCAGSVGARPMQAEGRVTDAQGNEVRFENLPPPVRLGMRVAAVQRAVRISPIVVIVEDESAYLRMLALWSLEARWPVLIDDGSVRASENIARFVRAFEPKEVIRWSPPEGLREPLPQSSEERRAAIEQGVQLAWGVMGADALRQRWEQIGYTPVGVVVMSDRDPAWTAGAVLAAGRGQLIIWTDERAGRADQVLREHTLRTYNERLIAGLDATGYRWRELGDDIEAVTVCQNIGSRLLDETGKFHLAFTDRIGRHEDHSRYAWCGMIFGDESTAAYRAMCSLFLHRSRALLFDGYADDFAPPFKLDGMIPLMTEHGWSVRSFLPPAGSLAAWRTLAVGGVGADFIHINTKGHWNWFDLEPGRASGHDVPLLTLPAHVHFVHSFSAFALEHPEGIAARWLESGAYAYVGSVHEPYLGAFQPGDSLARRMIAHAPWGVAARIDGGTPWKVNIIGDPLLNWDVAQARTDARPPVDGLDPLEGSMQRALVEERFADGIRALVMLGRDADVVRLVRGILASAPANLSTDAAEAAVLACARRNDPGLIAQVYERMSAEAMQRSVYRNALWQTLRPELQRTPPDESLVAVLRKNVRPEIADDDAAALAPAITRLYGRNTTVGFYERLISEAQSEAMRGRLEVGIKRL